MGFSRTTTSMVLKIFLSLSLLLFFHSEKSFALSSQKKRAFKMAKKAYKKKNYSRSLGLLKKYFNLQSKKTPIGAIQLAAYNFKKLRQYRKLDRAFSTLIKRKYRKTSYRITRRYKKAGNADAVGNIPPKLALYYYHKAFAISRIFMKDHKELSKKMKRRYKSYAIMYANLSSEGEFDDEDPDQIVADLNQFRKKNEAIRFKYGTFMGLNYVTWRDKLSLIAADGTESTLISNSEGLCLGGGFRKFNAEIEYNINGCIGINNATVGADTEAFINYFQKNVPVIGIMGAVGAIWKPKTGGTGIGIHIPVMIRKGDYTNPADADPNFAGTELEGTSIVSIGALVEGKWNFKKWEFSIKLGKFTKLDSSFWSLGLMYAL